MVSLLIIFLSFICSIRQRIYVVDGVIDVDKIRKKENRQLVDRDEDIAKVFVLYFPQFHEDELNNRIWGQGFTDWDNVKQSPQENRYGAPIVLPRKEDIGYYNLTEKRIRAYHATLAKKYLIDGFIYHHYWFYHAHENVPRISKPLEQMLLDGEPNHLFAFNWATDDWLGSWSGRGKTGELLYQQHFPYANLGLIKKHYQYLRQFFHLSNYYKIQGVPVFFIYPRIRKPLAQLLQRLSHCAVEDGFPSPGLHLIGAVNTMSNHELYTNRLHYQFQFSILEGELFYPFATFPYRQSSIPSRCLQYYSQRNRSSEEIAMLRERDISYLSEYKGQHKDHPDQDRIHYISTLTQFDNTPRRLLSDAQIWNRSFSPYYNPIQSFTKDLQNLMYYEKCCQRPSLRQKSGKFIVLNAWNEWAEGMAIEPSEKYGESWLQAIKQVKEDMSRKSCFDFSELG